MIYRLPGNAAAVGQSAKDAVELGAEIVNNAHPDLTGIPPARRFAVRDVGAGQGLFAVRGRSIKFEGRFLKAENGAKLLK